MGPATQFFVQKSPFSLHGGDELPFVQLAWESWGSLDADRGNAVLVFTGLSPDAHAASSEADPEPGWWEGMIGPGKAVDTNRFFVLCVNSLGSCKGSTGPASINPETGAPWRLQFPEIHLEDVAAATRLVTAELGITHLHAIVGPSMGGMTAQAWIKQFPDTVDRLALISSAAAATPFAIAIRSLQREAITTDRKFREGAYSDDHWPEGGMRMARKLGMISYRSATEWQQRFGRKRQDYFPPTDFGMRFSVESYLETHARRFVGSFDPACYLYLSRAMDTFEAWDRHGTLPGLFRASGASRGLVLGTETDILFPVSQQEELARAMDQAGLETRFEDLGAIQGHDAFLVDLERFGPPLKKLLEDD